MARKTRQPAAAACATPSAERAVLRALQQQALNALQAGHRAYLNAVSSNDPNAECLLTRNHRLDQAAARVEAKILKNIQAELQILAANVGQQREELETALNSLQKAVRHGESAAQAAAWLDRINLLLLRILA